MLAAATLLVAVFPAACSARREEARFAALEAGIASAQASLAILSSATPPAAPLPGPPPLRLEPPGPPPAAGARPVAASALLGAGPDALRRWFGDPDLRRPEGDAEILLFVGSGCALDVVLYADAGAKRVAHAAARADGPAPVTEADCLGGIGGGRGGGRGDGKDGGAGRAIAGGHTPGR